MALAAFDNLMARRMLGRVLGRMAGAVYNAEDRCIVRAAGAAQRGPTTTPSCPAPGQARAAEVGRTPGPRLGHRGSRPWCLGALVPWCRPKNPWVRQVEQLAGELLTRQEMEQHWLYEAQDPGQGPLERGPQGGGLPPGPLDPGSPGTRRERRASGAERSAGCSSTRRWITHRPSKQ